MLLAVATASPALADHGGGGGGQPPQGTALQSELYGASCTTASACTAVGDYVTNTGASKTLAERWNGTAWTLQSTPNPSGASYLNGVSCTSASACTAVGWYVTSTNATLTLAENWNGTTWTVQSTPNPSGAAHSFLQDVACTSASACTATGYYGSSAGVDQALAESWNGTTWTLQSTPTPSGATSSGTVRGVVHLSVGVHRHGVLRDQRRRLPDAGRDLERHDLDPPVHPHPERRTVQRTVRGVLHLSVGVHRHGLLRDQRRRQPDTGRELERHDLGHPVHPHPERRHVQRTVRGVVHLSLGVHKRRLVPGQSRRLRTPGRD